jgi:hypothetical protein
MTQVRTFRLALATGLLGLTVAACGGGSDDTATADTETPSSAPSARDGGQPERRRDDRALRSRLRERPGHRRRQLRGHGHRPGRHRRERQPRPVDARLRRPGSGLVDTLNSAQDITVFAPSNDAFAKVPAADLQALLATRRCSRRS